MGVKQKKVQPWWISPTGKKHRSPDFPKRPSKIGSTKWRRSKRRRRRVAGDFRSIRRRSVWTLPGPTGIRRSRNFPDRKVASFAVSGPFRSEFPEDPECTETDRSRWCSGNRTASCYRSVIAALALRLKAIILNRILKALIPVGPMFSECKLVPNGALRFCRNLNCQKKNCLTKNFLILGHIVPQWLRA